MLIIQGTYAAAEQEKNFTFQQTMFEPRYVVTDPLTGCQYFKGSTLTPRLNASGQQVCQPPR